MSDICVSAPGKLYLLGEYAVLDGAPALLTAVDRRVTVRLRESSTGWFLSAPELRIDRLALGENASVPHGLDDGLKKQLRLFSEACASVNALAPAGKAFDIKIESSQFLHDGHKLGLGSSAALAVALTAALAASRGTSLSPSTLFTLAASAHSAAQGGKGSGGDIAASVYGGRILFQQSAEPHGAELHQVNWPQDLDLFAVVTGTGSSTVDLVARVADYQRNDPAGYREDIGRLGALASRTEESLESAESFLALADDYFRGLETLDANANAGIVTQRHRELRALAASSGGIFKTSGAGGGDLGLVFAKLDSTDELQSAFTEAGATVIPVPYSPDGVRMEPV